jgi:hypothetical protein
VEYPEVERDKDVDDELKGYARSRAAVYRKRNQLIKSLEILAECRVISERECSESRARIDALFATMKIQAKEFKPKGGRGAGRPRSSPSVCKRAGCGRRCAEGQSYCSKEHSPLGFYGEASPAYLGAE